MSTAAFPPLVRPSASSGANFSDSDASCSSSDVEDPAHQPPAAEETIFSAYLQASGVASDPDLAKIRAFLASSRKSSFVACLICLERIRPSDPSWSCSSGCYDLFHLICIQSWAQQCSSRPSAVQTPDWHCPKCRLNYPRTQIPRTYLCYCGKVENPEPDPWITPHSCNEICGRLLREGCGHRCLLLCHPGPCPPCPKLAPSRCFCGSTQDVRRCGRKEFSCNRPCNKLVECERHRCPENCHPGGCPPCRVKGLHRCSCGKEERERECGDRLFLCEKPCDGVLTCGKHDCGRGCHSGPCGDCPLQGRRTCPCGKRVYEGITCDAVAPTCGSSCEKLLSCKIHRCLERCHQGACLEICRNVIAKRCRCGGLKKEVPCHQDLLCERKCQRLRDCGRHACKRRCCDGNCPPCPEVCGRKLKCNNHKCPSPCHRGICAPCPLMISIACSCGETHFEVPCGTEKEQKPPKCWKPCDVSRLCRHSSTSKPHRCHYGACPPCRAVCDEELPCGHPCKLRCHGPVPAPKREFSLKPSKRKLTLPGATTGSNCPPCLEIVLRSCRGEHVGEDRPVVCSNQAKFSCQNLCGNALRCGNHYCTKSCHSLAAEPCEQCYLPCQKERSPSCAHLCPRRCHVDDCPPCNVLVKRSCHCGALVHAFECAYYNGTSAVEQLRIRSCGGPCHKKLPNCPHLCSEICHPGTCAASDTCQKKVTVRCACNTLREEWICRNVQEALRSSGRDPKNVPGNQFGLRILLCSSECERKVNVVDPDVLLRRSDNHEMSGAVDDHVRRRRRRPDRIKAEKQASRFQVIKAVIRKFLLLAIFLLLTLALIFYGYKALFLLSDWMNEIDSKRLRTKGQPKF